MTSARPPGPAYCRKMAAGPRPADANYLRNLLPALMVSRIGVGGLAFVTLSIGALEGVEERDSGLASGLVNATHQIGGAPRRRSSPRSPRRAAPNVAPAAALTEGFRDALLAVTAFAVAAARRRADPPSRRASGGGGRSAVSGTSG
jgi:hypothetical protein